MAERSLKIGPFGEVFLWDDEDSDPPLFEVAGVPFNNGDFLQVDGSGEMTFVAPGGGGLGDVVGPASATDEAFARFDTTTGKLLQDSVVKATNAGAMTGITTLNMSGALDVGGTLDVTGTVSMDAALSMDAAGVGITSIRTTVYLFDLSPVTKVNFGGLADVDISATGKTLAVKGLLTVQQATTLAVLTVGQTLGVTGNAMFAGNIDLTKISIPVIDASADTLRLNTINNNDIFTGTGLFVSVGVLAANGASMTSNNLTFALLDTTPTKVNFAGNAAVDIGKTGLAVTMKGTLNVDEAATFDTTVDITGDLTVDTNTLFVESATNRVGVRTLSPEEKFHVGDDVVNDDSFIAIGAAGASSRGLKFRRGGNVDASILTDAGENFIITYDQSDLGRELRIEQGSGGASRLVFDSSGNVGIDEADPTILFDVTAKTGFTSIGGHVVKLTNKTGTASVAGQLVEVYSTTAVDDAYDKAATNSDGTIGIVYNGGVADGSEVWIVVSGIADVFLVAGCARGDRLISSVTSGLADVWNVGGAVATHFQEIGHCLETKVGAGLARVVLHFN